MKFLNFKLTLFIVIFIVTLVSIYFLTLEIDSCVVYAEQADQFIQSGQSGYQKSQRHYDRDSFFPVKVDIYLVVGGIVFCAVLLYNAHSGFGF